MAQNDESKLTARNLRSALFYLQNQKMTVEQLRAMLFGVEDQDAPLELGFSMWMQMVNKQADDDKRYADLLAVAVANPEAY